MKHAVFLIIWASLGLASVAAVAQNYREANLSEVRRYVASEVLDPLSAKALSSSDGRTTLLWGSAGTGRMLRCALIRVNDQDATLFEYNYNNRPTLCDAVVVHTEGIFIRGQDAEMLGTGIGGFTASIDPEGQVLWEISDRVLTQAVSRPDGGTGEFVGSYVGPARVLSFHEPSNLLLGTSQGEIRIANQERPVFQAHLVENGTAKLRTTGRTFGLSGNGEILAATSFGQQTTFLVAFSTNLGDGVQFYTYDGRQSIDRWEVSGTPKEWQGRTLLEMQTSSDNVALLWSKESKPWLTLATRRGDLLWESELVTTVEAEPVVELGPVQFVRADEKYIYAWHSEIVSSKKSLTVYDIATGDFVGIVDLDKIKMEVGTSVGLVESPTGLRLITYQRLDRRIAEHQFSLGEPISGPVDMADMGEMTDMGSDMGGQAEEPVQTEEGCGCQSGSGGPQPWGVMLMFGGLWMLRRGRRVAKG